jgi:uncharacterized protein (TIGR03083 family)
MKVAPVYDSPTFITFDDAAEPAVAVARQRQRFEQLLSRLDDEQWNAPSRCDGWRVRDVAAHLVTVNQFWTLSARAGLEGTPTRFLENFDPAAVPRAMVAAMDELSAQEIFEHFTTSNHEFIDVMTSLQGDDWTRLGESPVGHVPMWSLAHHALWDAWIHERDVALPLQLEQPREDDEIAACLHYVAVLGPALLTAAQTARAGTYSVAAHDPDVRFVIDLADAIRVRDGEPAADAPCLSGDAVALVEALSIRAPLPSNTPPEWRELASALATIFDTTVS